MERGKGSAGMGYALAAFLLWGLLPLYWKHLAGIPALELLAHRFLWSFVFVAGWLGVRRRLGELGAVFADPRRRRPLFLAAVLIAVNWGVYVWAVTGDHLIEASLGYYINPLVSVALGVLVLGERLGRRQWAAVGLAAAGVVLFALEVRGLPWISLALAFSFGFYGLVKKTLHLDALTGLAAETGMLVLPAALTLAWIESARGWPALGYTAEVWLLLLGAGVVTALPLLWFAEAVRRAALSTVGLIQYVTPTMKLLFGVFLYHEPFTPAHLASFALIWAALGLYTTTFFRRAGAAPATVEK
ncbi:transporter [Hydrogenibacillus schlegelii]|uniref:Transporter n=2 Tax=Hydrogenibacillus schlegelii TaxID=1484 RepID=A0A132N712_HYDSH|nr:transporter [Hydrogenibacillus schlegelii]OAR04890.1 transporter [Hydrogenibacillus schlegelii]